MKRGTIFDLDGTLVDSVNIHTRAWQELFSKHQITLTPEEIKEHNGKKNALFIGLVLERRNMKNLNPEKLSETKNRIVMDILKNEVPPIFPGVNQLLNLIKNKGLKMALATSSAKEVGFLLAKEIIDFFPVKIFAEDVVKGKPDPEFFLNPARRLNLKPAECIIFEDSESGVLAAKAGGFYCVAKENHLGQNLGQADLIIENYEPEKLIKLF